MNFLVRLGVILFADFYHGHARSDDKLPVPKALPLACTIRSDATCELGKAPEISVEISNWMGRDIFLVGGLDGSEVKWRYPLCDFEVIGPDGQSAVRDTGRCKFMNQLREQDFVRVPRGGKFDPYQKIDELGFFDAWNISPETFRAEGTYRIRFVYSTEQAEIRHWQGDGRNTKLVKLLEQVPKTTVTSNEITVKVVRPTKKMPEEVRRRMRWPQFVPDVAPGATFWLD